MADRGTPLVLADPRGPIAYKFARIWAAVRRRLNEFDRADAAASYSAGGIDVSGVLSPSAAQLDACPIRSANASSRSGSRSRSSAARVAASGGPNC